MAGGDRLRTEKAGLAWPKQPCEWTVLGIGIVGKSEVVRNVVSERRPIAMREHVSGWCLTCVLPSEEESGRLGVGTLNPPRIKDVSHIELFQMDISSQLPLSSLVSATDESIGRTLQFDGGHAKNAGGSAQNHRPDRDNTFSVDPLQGATPSKRGRFSFAFGFPWAALF